MFLSLVDWNPWPGRTGNGSEQKGRGGCVMDHLRETKVPFGVPYSSDPNSKNISDLRTTWQLLEGQIWKTGIFVDWEPSRKGAVQILHLSAS